MTSTMSVVDGGVSVGFPQWIRFFVDLGARWSRAASRRLLLLSTPGDTPAAGLVALGAMITRLGQRADDDAKRHFLRLWEYARVGHTPFLRHRSRRGLFSARFEKLADGSERVTIGKHEVQDAERFVLLLGNAREWRIDGDPVEEVRPETTGGRIPFAQFYEALVTRPSPILDENLSRTDSKVVLAGRSAGLQFTHELMSSLEFKLEDQRTSLAELLTISGWAPTRVSRVRYRSSRRVRSGASPFDRHGGPPEIIVADGYSAFIEVLNDPECQSSNADIIAIFDRTGDADAQEMLADRLANLRQWYLPFPVGDHVGTLPAGLSAALLQKGTA